MHISTLNPSALQALPPSTADKKIRAKREEDLVKVRTLPPEHCGSFGVIHVSPHMQEKLYRNDLWISVFKCGVCTSFSLCR